MTTSTLELKWWPGGRCSGWPFQSNQGTLRCLLPPHDTSSLSPEFETWQYSISFSFIIFSFGFTSQSTQSFINLLFPARSVTEVIFVCWELNWAGGESSLKYSQQQEINSIVTCSTNKVRRHILIFQYSISSWSVSAQSSHNKRSSIAYILKAKKFAELLFSKKNLRKKCVNCDKM